MALPFAMNLPWDALGENPFHMNDHARGGEESGLTDPPPPSVIYAATAILIRLGLASSRSGSRTVSTPALY